jgi:hypothetical protein
VVGVKFGSKQNLGVRFGRGGQNGAFFIDLLDDPEVSVKKRGLSLFEVALFCIETDLKGGGVPLDHYFKEKDFDEKSRSE